MTNELERIFEECLGPLPRLQHYHVSAGFPGCIPEYNEVFETLQDARETLAYVSKLPKCDFCDKQAEYDGKTAMGPWANMCTLHFGQYGTGLGTGRGQKLTVRKQQNEISFEQWMEHVERIIGQIGLPCDDLPDLGYWDWHMSGMSAETAAKRVAAEMGLDW